MSLPVYILLPHYNKINQEHITNPWDMVYYVYVLKSLKHGGLYKGYSQNLFSRLKAHNGKKSKYTARGVPWILVYYEIVYSEQIALAREKYLKSGAGRRFQGEQEILPNY